MCWLQGAWPELNYWQELHCQILIEATETSFQRLINPAIEKPSDQPNNQPMNSLEQSPSWEVSRSSANEHILCISKNPKVHCYLHRSPLHAPVLSQINPLHAISSYFLIPILVRFFHLCLVLQSWLSSLGFPTKTMHAACLPIQSQP